MGKNNSPTSSRRDDHPAKRAEKARREALIADQRISGFDTGTLGQGSHPKKSTADKGASSAKEKQIAGNRPGISPKEKK